MSTPPESGDEHGAGHRPEDGPAGPPPPPRRDEPEPSDAGGGAPPPGGSPPAPGSGPAPAAGAPPAAGPGQPTNGLAIAGLIASIVGVMTLWLCGLGILGVVPGLVLGFVARTQIRASGGQQGGDGLALAAIIVGGVGLGLAVLWFLLIAVLGMFGAMMPTDMMGPDMMSPEV